MIASQENRPYAAPSNVISVISRARTRNLPEVITNDFLRLAGIPEAAFGRVIQALRFLGLLQEDGSPTQELHSLAMSPDAEYQNQLANVVQSAYRDDFARVHPDEDPQHKIIDAFHRYQPRSQTQRMVMLFLGLCRDAGIPVLDAPRERQMVQRPQQARRQQSQAMRPRNVEADQLAPANLPAQDRKEEDRNLLFGVHEEDIALLEQEDFNRVWDALGVVARARARARTAQQNVEESIQQEDNEENG